MHFLVDRLSEPTATSDLHQAIGPYFHLIRNRLNSLQMSLYLARRTGDGDASSAWVTLEQDYRSIEKVVTQFQAIFHPFAMTSMAISPDLILQDIAARWQPWFASRGAKIEAVPSRIVAFRPFDPTRWSATLSCLAEWRARLINSGDRVILAASETESRQQLIWDEYFLPSSRRTVHEGREGLMPLTLLSRTIKLHGGTIRHDDRDGLRIHLEWPVSSLDSKSPQCLAEVSRP